MGEIGTERSDLLFLTRKHRSFSFIYPLYSLKSFSELGLREELLTAISEMGYENPTPVQEAVIPVLLHNPSFPNTLIPTANDSERTSEEASVMSEEASAISAEGADITEAAEESTEVIAEMTANADFDTEVSAESQRHRDIIALAQTGTGKTAAYGLPVLQNINPKDRTTQVIILSPTRELCLQIADDLKDYSRYIDGLHVVAVYGGTSIEGQIRQLKMVARLL